MVISRVLSRVSILISLVRGLITPLITTHEPPSRRVSEVGFGARRVWEGIGVLRSRTRRV